MAPWFDRMCVLEHYLGIVVPDKGGGFDWNNWSRNVLDHPAVKATREPKEKLIEYYKKYVDHTVKDKYYDKYYKNYKMGDYEETDA